MYALSLLSGCHLNQTSPVFAAARWWASGARTGLCWCAAAAAAAPAAAAAAGAPCRPAVHRLLPHTPARPCHCLQGAEKLVVSKMLVEHSNRRTYPVDRHAGVAIAGVAADGRAIVARATSEASNYKSTYGDAVPGSVLAERVGAYVHVFNLYWSVGVGRVGQGVGAGGLA